MVDTSNSNDLRLPSGSGKRTTPNVSSGWIVMVLSGLVAIVIFLVVTAQGQAKDQVLVANKDIAAGQKVDSSFFRMASVSVDTGQLNRLVVFKSLSSYNGYVATGPISNGDLITKTDLQPTAAADGNRSMSIPVDKTHANNGDLKVGDRVDVVNETSQQVAATNIQILSVNSSSGSTLGGSGSFSVTVSVSSDQAVVIAGLLKDGKFDLINSTGSASITPSSTTTTTIVSQP